MAKNTRERILSAALDLISENGYAGTNIQSIADAVGIVKSALYRHFESKEAIWNGLVESISAYYERGFGSEEQLPPVPSSAEEFKAMSLNMLRFAIYDEKIIKMRRILTLEQFRDETARDLATKYFLTGREAMFARMFEEMMKSGSLRKDDPAMLAFEFTAPVAMLVYWHDREPGRDEEIMARIEAHIDHFLRTYGEDH